MTRNAETEYQLGLTEAAAGHHDRAIVAFEHALRKNPGDIRVLFALGRTAEALNMATVAERLYRQVLTFAPGRTEAVIALTNLLRKLGKYAAAETLLAPLMTGAEVPAELWLSYGSLKREGGEDAAALDCYEKALRLKPDYIPALGNLADMCSDAGDFPAALALYQKLLTLQPDHHQARFSLALTRLAMGDAAQGWADYAARLDLPATPEDNHGLPRWDGGFHAGMRLLITAEQGVGDQIMFAGLIPQLIAQAKAAGAEIVLACEPRLETLFTRSFPDAQIFTCRTQSHQGRSFTDYAGLADVGGADCFTETGSLPGILGLAPGSPRPGTFLIPDVKECKNWHGWLHPLPRPWIGVCWRSGKMGGLRTRQYAPVDAWGAAMRDLPGSLICVQYDANASEMLGLELISGRKLQIPPGLDQKKEIDRSCALLASLDLVITAPTAVTWQAAGAGTNVARILEVPCWTQLGTGHESFSEKVTACVAPRIGDWSGAFAKAHRLLADA